MTINRRSLNGDVLNNTVLNGSFIVKGVGALVSFDQNNLILGVGTSVRFEQNVTLLTIGNGTIVSVDQSVEIIGSGNPILIAQNVIAPNTYLNRNNYDVDIYINNALIARNQICDAIKIKKTEGTASDCQFSIKPPLGAQNAEQYQGQPLFVNLTNSAGQVHRAFTGYIDNPALDLIEKKITFSCTDRRQTRITALDPSYVSSIGQYSIDVFGDPKDQDDELTKRMSTIPASFDFDNYGNPSVTNWKPKSTPDYILDDIDIFYDKPQVTYTNRTRTLNTINITVNYKFKRLHQQVANVVWSGYQNFLNDWYNAGRPSFPQKTTVGSAAAATSWRPLAPINYIDLWPAGGFGSVQWQPNTVVNTYAARVNLVPIPNVEPGPPVTVSYIWPDGKTHYASSPVLDVHGNEIMDITSTTVTDTSSMLCRGAQWVAGKKFAQNVTELYSIRMTSPQGINKFGIIDTHETVNITDPYNTSAWTGDKSLYNAAATSGTAENCTTNAAGYPKGATSITLANVGTGAFFRGDQILIQGDESNQYYTVQTDLTTVAGGTLQLVPPGLGAILQGQEYIIQLVPGATTDSANFFVDEKPNYNKLALALNCVINKGHTSLLKAYRDVQVSFKRLLWPEIDLVHTVQTTATWIATTGKVSSIEHFIDTQTGQAYTQIVLRLSRASVSDTQSEYIVQTPPYEDKSYIGLPTQLALETHIGVDPSYVTNPLAITWNGWIANATLTNQTGLLVRTNYPQSFIVDYPPIATPLTQDRTITQNPPGVNNGVTTNSAGYLAGVTTIFLAAGGTGQLLQGDAITIAGDTSGLTYTVQEDILDVSGGGILVISPGLGATLSMTTHAITSSPPGNQFTVQIPNDPLVETF